MKLVKMQKPRKTQSTDDSVTGTGEAQTGTGWTFPSGEHRVVPMSWLHPSSPGARTPAFVFVSFVMVLVDRVVAGMSCVSNVGLQLPNRESVEATLLSASWLRTGAMRPFGQRVQREPFLNK